MNRTLLQDRRVWLAGGVLVAVVIAAASWFLLISPKLSSTDDLGTANGDAQTQNAVVAGKNAKLAKQNREIGTLKNKLIQSIAGLPPTSGLPEFTRELTSLAAGHHVTLTTINVAPPTAPAAEAPASPAPSDSSEGSASPSSAPTTSADPTSASTGSVLTIDVTLNTNGSMARQTAFLKDLQDGPRRVLVTSSQLSVANGSRVNSVDAATSMTTQLTIFTAPLSAAQIKSIQTALKAD